MGRQVYEAVLTDPLCAPNLCAPEGWDKGALARSLHSNFAEVPTWRATTW